MFVGLVLASIALALPQKQPGSPVSNSPTATTPMGMPLSIGELPREGLNGVPFPENFDGLAKLLGFDPAKATPDSSGKKCQESANGRFCFGASGSSFTLGHPGGAFNGQNWNPITGKDGVSSAGGLLIGLIGDADDVATSPSPPQPEIELPLR